MKKIRYQDGFSALEALLILVIIVIIGFVGWYVWKNKNKINNANVPTISSTSSKKSITSSKSTTSTTQTTNTYSGWQTYCDSHNYCFKYPALGWTIDTSSAEQTTLLSADKSIEIDYLYSNPHDNGLSTFMPVSINKLADGSQAYEVVGGLYDNVTPQFNVVDVATLNTYPLKVGQSRQFPNYPHFSDNHVSGGTTTGTFRALSTTSGAQTNAWFANANAKTSLLILESLYYK